MTQKSAHAEKAEHLSSPDFATMAKKRVEELAEAQSEFFEEIRQANQIWLDRLQAETALASEFTSKLAASHSAAETTTACQDWAKRRMELLAEDGKRLMSDSQKFMTNAARLLSHGWLPNGRNGGGT